MSALRAGSPFAAHQRGYVTGRVECADITGVQCKGIVSCSMLAHRPRRVNPSGYVNALGANNTSSQQIT